MTKLSKEQKLNKLERLAERLAYVRQMKILKEAKKRAVPPPKRLQ